MFDFFLKCLRSTLCEILSLPDTNETDLNIVSDLRI